MRTTFWIMTGILLGSLNISAAIAADVPPAEGQATTMETNKVEKINTTPTAHDEKNCPMHKGMKNCPMHKGAAQEKCDHEQRS